MPLHQNNKLFLVHDKLYLVSHWPPASEIGMLLITTFVELSVVAAWSRTRAGSPQAASRRPCCALALRTTAWARHGHGMRSVNQTRQNCVNQMGRTHSKPLAARHGRGMGAACYVWIGLEKYRSSSLFRPHLLISSSPRSSSVYICAVWSVPLIFQLLFYPNGLPFAVFVIFCIRSIFICFLKCFLSTRSSL
jgi:hypothetical protein